MVAVEPIRAKKKIRTREQLIATAFAVFCDRGIANTRMGDIARAASVAHGTVFLHFSSRDELVSEVIWTYSGRVALKLHDLVKVEVSVREVLQAHLCGLAEFEDFYFRLISESSSLPEAARTTMLGIQSAVSDHLWRIAERKIANGELRQISAALLFNTWIGLVDHYILNRHLFAPEGSVLRRYGPDLIDHYLGLLAT